MDTTTLRDQINKLSYQELQSACAKAQATLNEAGQKQSSLYALLDRKKAAIKQREGELVLADLGLKNDPELVRLNKERIALEADISRHREEVALKQDVAKLTKSELDERGRQREDLVTQVAFKDWQQQDEHEKLEAARRAVVAAILAHCGAHTTPPGFVDAEQFMCRVVNSKLVGVMLQDEVERVRHQSRQRLIEQDRRIGV